MNNTTTNSNETSVHFSYMNADSYDEQRARLNPLKDALHLSMRMILSGLRDDARVLCVGAGTGSELIYLAQAYPGWQFTVVEPAADMMSRCRQQAQQHAIDARCDFHEGYIDSLPPCEPFDAATSILVSHFIPSDDQRVEYFSTIAKRLLAGAHLINADLSTDLAQEQFDSMLNIWVNMHKFAGMPMHVDSFAQKTPPASRIESLLTASGFEHPVVFYQNLFIKAWFSTAGTNSDST